MPPWFVAHRLCTTVPHPEDVRHLLCLIHDVVRRRVLRLSVSRDPIRTKESVCKRLMWVLHVLEPCAESRPVPWRTLLPTTINLDTLVALLAKALAMYHRRPRHRNGTTPSLNDPRSTLLTFFRTCIADGVFEPTIPNNAHLSGAALNQHLLRLEAENADRFRAVPTNPVVRHRPEIHTEELEAMVAACQTPRERAYLLLVSTTGLRPGPSVLRWSRCGSCAIGTLRVGDVWDADRREVRSRIALTEKNSQIRVVHPTEETREALGAYVASLARVDARAFLFHGARRPDRPAPFVPRTILRSICQRAGLPAFTPHQFRRPSQGVPASL